jgi:hypothetical protein
MGAVVVAAIGLVGAFVFLGASQPTYACSTEWVPDPTSSPAPGASPRLGYVQPDMGRLHDVKSPQRYTYCPPASGTHLSARGAGPIQPGFYGPSDATQPQGWLHNLEHGSLVVLYRCRDGDDGCSESAQQEMRQLYSQFPPTPVCGLQRGTIGPVIARFDEMAYPYAAVVWNRVLPLDSFDRETILRFYETEGERTHPEKQCTPTPSPSPAGSPATSPDASPAAS